MGNVFAVLSDISPFVTIGWPVFAAWTYWQFKWYQRSRLPVPAPATRTRRRSNRRSDVRVPVATQDSNRSTFTTLGLDGATRYGVPMSSSYPEPPVAS